MEAKTSLEKYRDEKLNIRKENFYDNSQGSALLFRARAGCLRTKSFVAKYSQNDEVSVVCGKETQHMRHIVLECEGIHPNPHEGNIRLPEALRFKGYHRGSYLQRCRGNEKKIRMLVDEKQRGEYCLRQLPPVTEKKCFVPNNLLCLP